MWFYTDNAVHSDTMTEQYILDATGTSPSGFHTEKKKGGGGGGGGGMGQPITNVLTGTIQPLEKQSRYF